MASTSSWALISVAPQENSTSAFTPCFFKYFLVRFTTSVAMRLPFKSFTDFTGEFSWGATEVKAHELVDAIVEVTETGSSLRANKLRIVDELLSSTPRLIANHTAWKDKWKRRKIETLAMLLRGALEAEAKVGLKMNIQEKNLPKLLKSLPALRNPTISSLSLKGWIAVETIIDEHVVREFIPKLKAAGAEGIIEYPLNKVVY